MKKNNNLEIRIYTAESYVKNPWLILRDFLSDWKQGTSLGWRLFVRNYKGQFRQSLLGFTWAIIPPLLTAFVWVFLNNQKIINVEQPSVPYPAFVLVSTLLWSIFAQSILTPMQAINSGKGMIVKLNFPKESLLISGILQIMADLVIKIGLIILVFVFLKVMPATSVLLAPVGILMLIMLGFTIGMLILPFGLLYNDIQRGISAFLPFWMLLTPVIYPSPQQGLGATLNTFNPVSPILSTTRDWIFGNPPGLLQNAVIISLVVFIFLIFSIILFRLSMPFIIERSGN